MAQMTAADIARLAGGRRLSNGNYLISCPVPTHGRGRGDRNPSCSVRDGKIGQPIFHCHAGCDGRQVIEAAIAKGWLGNDPVRGRSRRSQCADDQKSDQDTQEARRKQIYALKLFAQGQPIAGTLAETYLASRGLCPTTSEELCFHPQLKHKRSGKCWPALIARITNGVDGTPQAIHRTFLSRDGLGKAPIKPQRMMLGPVSGGCVRLGPVAEHILLGEGIETCLSAMQAIGLPAWAALTTSGFKGLDLPPDVLAVTILCDGDDAGRKAARSAATRWAREGRQVRIAHPPEGQDFNDILRSGAAPSWENAS